MARDRGFVGLKWELGACVGTFYDEDDVLRAKKDAHGKDPRVEAFEVHAPLGSVARPFDAEVGPDGNAIPNRMCTMLHADDGDEQHAMLIGDPRVIAKLPLLKQGERLEHGFAGQFTRYHQDGKITHFTTHDGTPEGRSVFAQVARDGFHWESPSGRMHLDPKGFRVLTGGGAQISAGSVFGLPAPLDSLGLQTFLRLQADMVQINCKVMVEGTPATAGIPAEPVAKATSLLVLAGAVQTALTAIDVALVACGAALQSLGNGSAGPPIAAATATVVASQTALAAALLAVPSKAKMVT